MIALLDTPQDLEVCQQQIGCEVGQLLSPLTRRRLEPGMVWGCDNGCFASFHEKTFFSLLSRNEISRNLCKFVCVPDIPGEAQRTLELFGHFSYRLAGWPLAYVVQNGQEHTPIPWPDIAAIFVGGDDIRDGMGDWKLGPHAVGCIRTAKMLGKWVHIGRLNTRHRFDYFDNLGADSFDGTGISRYTHMREALAAPTLFSEVG